VNTKSYFNNYIENLVKTLCGKVMPLFYLTQVSLSEWTRISMIVMVKFE